MVLALSAILACTCGAPGSETDFIRQLAKDKPPVNILCSGPEALKTGRDIQAAIEGHRDLTKGKKVNIGLLGRSPLPNLDAESLIVLVGRDEMNAAELEPLGSELAGLPCESDNPHGKLSAVGVNKQAGKLTFHVRIVAPEARFLSTMAKDFVTQRFPDYRVMALDREYLLNRVTVFAPEEIWSRLKDWGTQPGAWNDIKLSTLASPSAPRPLERRVFIVTNDTAATLPPDGLSLYREMAVGADEVMAVRKGQAALLAGPKLGQIRRLADRYSAIDSIPEQPMRFAVEVLGNIGPTVILLTNTQNRAWTDSVRSSLGTLFRRTLKLDVRERGEILRKVESELVLQDLLGNPSALKQLRDAAHTKYLWCVEFLAVDPQVQYHASQSKMTPYPGVFGASEPMEPSPNKPFFGGKKPAEQYQREMQEWRQQHSEWEQRKRSFEQERDYEAPVQWNQELTKTSQVDVKAHMLLLDLESVGKVRLEVTEDGRYSDSKVVESKAVTVRGHLGAPDSLSGNSNDVSVDDRVFLGAAGHLCENLVAWTEEHCLFADVPTVAVAPDPAVGMPPKPPPTIEGMVADVAGGRITINRGSEHGVRVGDRFRVVIMEKLTRDPETKKVIDREIKAAVVIRIVQVKAKVATGTLGDQRQRSILLRVKTGMRVERIP